MSIWLRLLPYIAAVLLVAGAVRRLSPWRECHRRNMEVSMGRTRHIGR